ncbi:MAG: hypothetical protein ACN6PF_19610 [Achromobacter veterisilvae]
MRTALIEFLANWAPMCFLQELRAISARLARIESAFDGWDGRL